MLFLKVGKAKHKFKLKLTVMKFKYQPENQIDQSDKVHGFDNKERGSHEVEMLSAPVKKGSVKFPKNENIIPMTLFYDEDKNEYLEKQVIFTKSKTQVKTYICDENGNTVRSIGKTVLNIAEFAMKEKFGLEVEIEGESKKVKEDVVITFQIILERQDDDSKSVNSMSEDEIEYKSSKFTQLKQKQKSKSKNKQNLLYPITQSSVTVKSAEDKLKNSGISESDDKFSQKTKKFNTNDNSPIKTLKQSKKMSNKPPEYEQSENENFFTKLENKLPKMKREASIKREVSIKRDSMTGQSRQKYESKRSQHHQREKSNLTNYGQDEETKNSSIELRLHLAQSSLNTLQKQNTHLRQQTNRLKSIIEHLIEQKSQKQITESTINSQTQQQIDNYKKMIIEKEMKINELEGLNKLVVQREGKKDKEIKELKGQVKELSMRLEHEKNKLAKVLQTAMEAQNMDLLEIIQSEINDQFY